MKKFTFLAIMIAFVGWSFNAKAQPGNVDATFNNGVYGPNQSVSSLALQSDGKIIIGGGFTTYNGTASKYLARLNSDGSLDATFNVGTGASGGVKAIAIQSDGKIIIGGAFSTYNGTTSKGIARLNTDGSIDASFNSGLFSSEVYAVAILSDGKIIIGGWYSLDGTTGCGISRLNTDGSIDASFNVGTGANYTVFAIAIQNDGKIIIGGEFQAYNGNTCNGIARLNSDGSYDTSFNVGTGTGTTSNSNVRTINILSDGKIIIAGKFVKYNEISIKRIARLNSDGSLETTFGYSTGGLDGEIKAVSIQNDGKIVIGGAFLTFDNDYSTQNYNHTARLNTNGRKDTTFNISVNASFEVYTNIIQNDGKIIIGGTSYAPSSLKWLARLNGDATTVTIPTAPTNLTVLSQKNIQSKMILSWTDNSNNEDGFKIERSTDDVTFTEIGTTATNINTYTDSTGAALTLYYYRVTAYNSAGSSAYSNTISGTTSGINNISVNNTISMYPNPNTGKFAVSVSSGSISTIEIYNLSGEKVFAKNLKYETSTEIDITNSPCGIYFVKITDGAKTYTSKIVVE